MAVKAIPDGFHSITPYLICRDAPAALEYYKTALGARELLRLATPDGGIAHAEIEIGDSRLMLADEHPDMGFLSPASLSGSGVSLMLYVDDADAAFRRAIKAGAEELRPVADQFYGDRSGTLKDPFGHTWTIGTHTEDLSQEEIDRRFAEMISA